MLSNRSIPKATVIPELAYPDVNAAADWLCAAFGFTVRLRIANHRVQMNAGDGALVARELREGEQVGPGIGASVMVRVEDVDAHCERAAKHGARIRQKPETYPYGERQYSCEDHAGHVWKFSQSVADVHPEEWGGSAENL
jgi:uncharacterized glyoxalase superfamily protein PhnB